MTRLFVALALTWSLLLGTLAVVGAAPTDAATDTAACRTCIQPPPPAAHLIVPATDTAACHSCVQPPPPSAARLTVLVTDTAAPLSASLCGRLCNSI